ncbi:MAG TPA: hypothetical protein VEV17_01490 [Bryobacteraceae bacterium]|nr:hypothetical protein [Bryobacteraceae bacterium]
MMAGLGPNQPEAGKSGPGQQPPPAGAWNRPRPLSILTVLFIGSYFAALNKDALIPYFSPGDCTNLYRSWASAGALVKANLLFFLNSPFYRPLASAWYASIYYFAGFNPVPFHATNVLILAANVWLTYCVVRRLADSRGAGALGALLISYYGPCKALYFDTEYIFDVLCYFFYFSALLFYLRMRSRPRTPKLWELVWLSVLYVCALNSKEVAITLPFFLAAYEWLYLRPPLWPPRLLLQWVIGEGRAVLVTAALTALFAVGRAFGPNALLNMAPYRPVFTWSRFLETSENSLGELFFQAHPLQAASVLLIWLALFAIAWITKIRALKFAWLFLMFSVVPLAFITPRAVAQYYVPLFGWVLYAAAALVAGTRSWFTNMTGAARYAQIGLILIFLATAGFLYRLNRRTTWLDVTSVAAEGEELHSIVEQVHQLRPALRRGSRVLFLDDPLTDGHRLMYVMRLSYGDRDLTVDSAKFMRKRPSDAEIASYDYVFDYREGLFFDAAHPPSDKPEPSIVYQWGYPAVFHQDWSKVARWRPAKRGEVVISLAKDLGLTEPPVPAGQPFPVSPLAQVVSPIEVRVSGEPAQIHVKIGWPGLVNRYRVDFRIPKNIPAGTAAVVLRSGNTGPATMIPVR